MPERDRHLILVGIIPSDPAFGWELQRTGDDGGDPDEGDWTTIEEGDGTRRSHADELPSDGAVRWYRWRHVRSGWTEGAWSASVAGVPTLVPAGKTLPATPPDVVPTFAWRVDEPSTNTGRMIVAVVDPQHRMRTLEFRTRAGNAAWSSWASGSILSVSGETTEYAATVALVDGAYSRIEARSTYYDERPSLVTWTAASGPMDPGAFPDVADLVLMVDASGNVTARVEGDTDTLSLKVRGLTSGAPTLAEIRAGTLINAASGTTGTLVTLTPGQTAYVGALAYSGASAGGLESAAVQRTIPRAAYPPKPTIDRIQQVEGTGEFLWDVSFLVSNPSGLGGTLSVWTNPSSYDSPDPTGSATGTYTVASVPYTASPSTLFNLTGGGTGNLLNEVPGTKKDGKTIFAEFVDSAGQSTGKVAIPMSIHVKIITEGGIIDGTLGVEDGVSTKFFPKGATEGTARNGLVHIFAAPYQNAPVVVYQGGATMEERSKWGTRAQADASSGNGSGSTAKPTSVLISQVYASEVTSSSISHKLYLVAKGSLTAKSAAFSSPASVSVVGSSTGAATPASGDVPSADGRYTASFVVSVEHSGGDFDPPQSGTVVVAIMLEVDGGAPVEVGTVPVPYTVEATGSEVYPQSYAVASSQIAGGNDSFYLKLKSVSGAALVIMDASGGGMTWSTDASALYASMTPNGDPDAVRFMVIGAT